MLSLAWNLVRLMALASACVWATPLQGRFAVEDRVQVIPEATLSGAAVLAHNLNTGLQSPSRPDAQGASRLDLRRGRNRVTAAVTGFEVATQIADIADDSAVPVVLRLGPADFIQAVVVPASR